MSQETVTATSEHLDPCELVYLVGHFSHRFPVTRHGAHTARRLAECELAA